SGQPGAHTCLQGRSVVLRPRSSKRYLAKMETPPLYSTDVRVSSVVDSFINTARTERTLTGESLPKYRASIACVIRTVGDPLVGEVNWNTFLDLKQKLIARRAGPSYINGVIHALKGLLNHCRHQLGLPVADFSTVRVMRVPRRAVIYLTTDELEQFISTIKIQHRTGRVNSAGLCFRTLVEVLAGTGMRVSEALMLDISTIDWKGHDARIIGKGGKQRTIFFTESAVRWSSRYLEFRHAHAGPLFVSSRSGQRLTRHEAQRLCRIHARRSGIGKHVTLHVLRHTFATTLLKNGCPIGHIQGMLGHDRLETTCRYYLGLLNDQDLKKAHERFLER
ncbi:MAG: tyrosine-type recombinase/integrase, partial [Bacteroidota bacterium]